MVVPLCDNALIDCGSELAGRPRDLAHNLYWGAVFGQRRFFERKNSGWERVEVTGAGKDGLLERAVFRRQVSRAPWGGKEGETTEQLVVLEAIDGTAIDSAVQRFFRTATGGGTIRFKDGEQLREERIQVVGYAGHNRLMDGVSLPRPSTSAQARPIPSFVMACISRGLFRRGAAPGGIHAALDDPHPDGAGRVRDRSHRPRARRRFARASLRDRAVAAYAHWQRISSGVASSTFTR